MSRIRNPMNWIRTALVLCIALAAMPAQATEWLLVDNSNTTLWFDSDSIDWDADYVYFHIYHGAWSGASTMTNNLVELSYDCWEGNAYVWNTYSQEWDYSDAYTEHEMLSELAWDICYFEG